MDIMHSEASAAHDAKQPPITETGSASGEANRERAITTEKEGELVALDKELESAFWKLDYLKRNGQIEQVRAAQAAQRHIGFMRELLSERGQGSVVNDVFKKGFSLQLEIDLSDFGRFTVVLEPENPGGTGEGMKVFEDIFGEFDGDAYPSKESLKN